MMSPNRTLMVNESPLILSPTLATEIGLNEALFLQQLHYWLGQSSHIHDGHTWVYNTKEQWAEQFPFWSSSTLKRAISSLRRQGLIYTTDRYNPSRTDRKLWYTIDYERLSTISGQSSHQSPATSHQLPDQNELVEESNQRHSGDQDDSEDEADLAHSPDQDEPAQRLNVDGSLYGTETTHRDYDRDYPENRTTTTVVESDRANEELVVVESEHGTQTRADERGKAEIPHPCSTVSVSKKNPACAAPETTSNQPLTTNNQLQSHGLSRSIALDLVQKHPEAYLQEKIAFLEYELERRSDLANPAGWLRCAIEQDYAPPPGYHAAQQAAAQAAHWQAILAEQNRSVDAHHQAQAQVEAARLAQESARIAEEAARFYPLHGTTETLIHVWETGYKAMVQTMSLGGLLDTLEQSVLLSFADGHAKIGVKCQYALQRLQQRGKHALRNALNFALADTLQGQRASYELVLV